MMIDIKKVNILEVIGKVVDLKPVGSEYRGLCPFHNEKEPSFFVNKEKGVYHCFGCGAKGNVITFLKEYYGYSYYEVVDYLSKEFNIEIDTYNFNKEKKVQKLIEITYNFYHNYLMSDFDLLKRVSKFKNLKLKTIKHFKIGFSNENLLSYIKNNHPDLYDEEILMRSGLFYKMENDIKCLFENRIIIPIYNKSNKVIALMGRYLGEVSGSIPKYIFNKNSFSNDEKYFYNKINIKPNANIFICEGVFDALRFFDYNLSAFAILGNTNKFDFIKHTNCDIYVAFDRDDYEKMLNGNINNSLISSLIKSLIDAKLDKLHIFDYSSNKEAIEPDETPEYFVNIENYQNIYSFLSSLYEKSPLEKKIVLENFVVELYSKIGSYSKRKLFINNLSYNLRKALLGSKKTKIIDAETEIKSDILLKAITDYNDNVNVEEILSQLDEELKQIFINYLRREMTAIYENPKYKRIFELTKQKMVV